MLAQINIEERAELINKRNETYKKKYLSEIIDEEKPEFKSNNLILSPVGSGKSHLIENRLIPKDYNKKVIYLTSNTALKDSLCPKDNAVRKILAEKGESRGFYTSANKSAFGDVPYKVHVMTYSEFGERIGHPHQTFTQDVGLIFCDEIHSLPRYFEYDNSYKLGIALYWLLQKQDGVKIFYFTATQESLEDLKNKQEGYFKDVSIFNYLHHPEIRRYVAKFTNYISHIEQARVYLRSAKESFNYNGYKALAFTKLISEQEKIEKMAKEEGLKPITLWSVNNREHEMSEEQLRVRKVILNTGLIPEPYNVLIINGAMQEGWNLYDDKVSLAILDTTDITEQIQSLGRIRKDINLVIKKTNDESLVKSPVHISEAYLNVNLTTEDKNFLCDELQIIDNKGRVRRWTSAKEHIKYSGYKIEDKTVTVDGKRTRVSIITLDDEK